MADMIDNMATSTQKGATLPPTRDKIGHFESITLTTLGDGHAVPSISAVTPATSTKVEKLMDTVFNVTSRCNMLLHAAAPVRSSRIPLTAVSIFIDTHDEENSGLTSTESARSQNFDRYTFDMSGKRKKGGSR